MTLFIDWQTPVSIDQPVSLISVACAHHRLVLLCGCPMKEVPDEARAMTLNELRCCCRKESLYGEMDVLCTQMLRPRKAGNIRTFRG
ncbi:hypothetical protein BaRGS_00028921 [Batillaria attramentaria]|uniref:Uncharacterized protein n=1 Tax=Batillaria attramentaria TaxID=370345 RepID=A0ABD0JXR0_9CAEN